MPVDATPETFKQLTSEGSVFVDFWGPRCQPCLAMMPTIKDLEEDAGGAVRVVKVDSTQNRDVCRELRVFGLPTYILMRDGEELERLSGEVSKQQVEEAFVAKLASIHPQTASIGESLSEKTGISEIDKRVLPFPEPRRIRDREHVRHVIKQPCLVCGRRPPDPHHLRFAQSRALGRKVSDEFTVPLCRAHHREVHRYGEKDRGGGRRE